MNFKEYIKNNYTIEDLYTISHHGCEGGINGMIYYTETTAIYNQFEDELHEIIDENWQESGFFPEYIIKNFGSPQIFRNNVVWFCAEVVAGELLLDEEVA